MIMTSGLIISYGRRTLNVGDYHDEHYRFSCRWRSGRDGCSPGILPLPLAAAFRGVPEPGGSGDLE